MGTGYEFDRFTADDASDCRVLMFIGVVESAVLVSDETAGLTNMRCECSPCVTDATSE